MSLSTSRPRGTRTRFLALMTDYAYLLPGLPIAVFSFSLLVAMTVLSVATAILWIGALLMPLTLIVASGFAELDRARLRIWGAAMPPVHYRQLGAGFAGKMRILRDPRRWLDLVFETVITLPLRLLTFILALVWTVAGPAGLTYFFWSVFLPDERSLIQLLYLINPALVPESPAAQYALDAGAYFLLGLVFLVTLPAVMRGLAILDAGLSMALLVGDELRGDRHSGGQTSARPHGHRLPGGLHRASFSATAWSWIGAGFTAVVLLAVGWPVTAAVHGIPVTLAMVLVLAHCGSLLLTLYRTVFGLLLSLAAVGGFMIAADHVGASPWPWLVTVLITQCAVLSVAALARPWYYAATAWSAAAVLALVALLTLSADARSGALANSIVGVSVTAGIVVIGALARLWILNAGRLEAAERSSAEQDRRSKELQDRNRIARELHDVVAHSMSVISVQAATAQYRNPGMDDSARREFEEIAGSSRQALREMRMLLSILRGDDEVPTAPEPGLEDIDALIASTRASGTTIRYDKADQYDDAAPALDTAHPTPAVGLAAYRIIQEALSNALRHAPGAEVEVKITVDNTGGARLLRITVLNGPSPQEIVEPAPGAGLGLGGLRERSAAVGGSAQAGPTASGGFTVNAELPL